MGLRMLQVDRAIRQQRQLVKRQALSEVGPRCECCEHGFIGLDLHEVFVTRAMIPKIKQRFIMVRRNCALVCRDCHREKVSSPEFKERFAIRLKALGYGEPFSLVELDKSDYQ